jgi:hypothetical protein
LGISAEIEREEFDERDLNRFKNGLEWVNAFYIRNGRNINSALDSMNEVLKWRKKFSANGKLLFRKNIRIS